MTWVGSGSAWIRNFCLDPDPELGKFRAGSGSGINHFGSTTQEKTLRVFEKLFLKLDGTVLLWPDPEFFTGSGSNLAKRVYKLNQLTQ